MSYRFILVVTCGLASSSHLWAGPEEDILLLYPNEEIVNIATGTSKPIHLAPSVASVITANDIKASGARTLEEALEYVPGIHSSISFNRHDSIFSIRGIHTDNDPQTLFLINGIPYSDSFTGGRPQSFRLGVENISRIEIIRGPGSAVYGADALSSVINVITKDADEMAGSTVGVRHGSFNSNNLWAQHGGNYGGWDTAISFEYFKTDGDDGRVIDSDLQTIFDGRFNTSATLAPHATSTYTTQHNTSLNLSKGKWNVWLNSWVVDEAGVGPGATQALDPVGRQETTHNTFAINYEESNLAPQLNWKVHLDYHLIDKQAYFQLFPPGAVIPIGNDGNAFTSGGGRVLFSEGMHGNPGGDMEQLQLENSFTYSGFNKHLLRLAFGGGFDDLTAKETSNFGPGTIDGTQLGSGINVINGQLTSKTNTANSFMPPSNRKLHFISLQDEWSFAPDWELTTGVRHDNYSDFGTTTNPRMALVWATRYNLTTKMLYGRAFRAPSFNELYLTNNPAATGNPNLAPETIDVAELVFDYRPTFDLRSVVNIYRYELDDLIDYVSGVSQNINDQEGHGFEMDVSWHAATKLDIHTNFAWQHSEDSRTGDIIPDAPGRQASLAVRYKLANSCSLAPQANWVGDRVRATNDPRAAIADYTLVDVTYRCTPSSSPIEWALSVRNAFDKDAREPSPYYSNLGRARIEKDFPLEGRNVYIEAIYHFDQ